MPGVGSYYVDLALTGMKADASDININNLEPTSYAQATSGGAFLGKKAFGAGAVFPGAIAAGTGSSHKLTTAAVTDGAISLSGTASHWSITMNGAPTRLVAQGALSATQSVTTPNPFTLGAFDIQMAYG
jgi:hypothetical protein